MKVVILAGGFGTRISEESHLIPKPMIEIGGKPILWHIMKYYSSYGYNEFILCAGYKQYTIKEFFSDYFLHTSDVTFDFSNNNKMIIHNNTTEPWIVTIVDTGLNTMTGGRLKRIKDYIGKESFMMTYGDGVSNVDLNKLQEFHKQSLKIATITAIQPGGKFGQLDINDNLLVKRFKEKNIDDGGWINGGFMVFNNEIFDYIDGDETILEREPFINLAKNHQLIAFKHEGFWQCMDTLRDKQMLEEIWNNGEAKWKKW
jgi:glucose-1-phosphate cytidylyltransferase